MWGWFVVLAGVGAVGAAVRWYRRSDWLGGYTPAEQSEVRRIRVNKMHSHGDTGGG